MRYDRGRRVEKGSFTSKHDFREGIVKREESGHIPLFLLSLGDGRRSGKRGATANSMPGGRDIGAAPSLTASCGLGQEAGRVAL